MDTREADTHRLHLGVLTPWRQAIAALTGDDGPDIGDLRWDMPAERRPDDSVLQVVYSPHAAIVEWDVVVSADWEIDGLDVDSLRFYPDGVSVAAVERRLGYSLPTAPGTFEPGREQEVMDAVEAESEAPTPWRHLRAGECVDPFGRGSPVTAYGCPGCGDTDVDLVFHELGGEDLHFAEPDVVFV